MEHTDLTKTKLPSSLCFLDDFLANVCSEHISAQFELFVPKPVHEPRTQLDLCWLLIGPDPRIHSDSEGKSITYGTMTRLFIVLIEHTIAYDYEQTLAARVDWSYFDHDIRFSCPPPVAAYHGCNR
jgi:hypothetical protein